MRRPSEPSGSVSEQPGLDRSIVHSVKRYVPKVITLLVSGAIINIAIAWGSALCVDAMSLETVAQGNEGVTAADHPRWNVSVAASRTSTLVQADLSQATFPLIFRAMLFEEAE